MDDLGVGRSLDNPLAPITKAWSSLMRRAIEWKKELFQDDADDIQQFFNGCKDDFWGKHSTSRNGFLSKDAKVAPPDFQMKVMKVAEAVGIFGPSLYANNPTLAVNPRKFTEIAPITLGIPPELLQPQQGPNGEQMLHPIAQQYQQQVQQREALETNRVSYANIFRDILNYEQRELDKQSHMRRIIDEALICGLGIGWTELVEYEGSGRKLVGTFYEPVRNFIADPDADSWESMLWVARERTMPYWEAEELFHYAPGDLQKYCKVESLSQQSMSKASSDTSGSKQKTGKTNDLITFWEIYTKMGVGDRLKGVPEELQAKAWGDAFPKYCRLCICENVPFPLNIPPNVLDDKDEIMERASWPIPLYEDNQWPCVPMAFHPIPGQLWPQSHFKPALGEIQWLTWCFSFMANKVKTSCGTILGALAVAKDDLEEQLTQPGDNKIVWIKDAHGVKDIRGLLSYVQQPEFHQDLWNMMQAMLNEVDKRLGTAEVLYGMSSGSKDRSATETDIKYKSASSRIMDMGNAVEASLSRMCRNEAIANWALVEGKDVSGVLGPEGAMVWDQQIKTMPVEIVCREFNFEIVAGSSRKMNKQAKAELMNQAMTTLGPTLQSQMSMGIFGPWNEIVLDWAKANDIENPERYIAQPPPPQPPPPDPKAEAELQKIQMEGQLAQQTHQLDTQMKLLEMEDRKQQMVLKAQESQAKLAMEQQKQQMQLAIMEKKAMLEMRIAEMKARQELTIEREKSQQQMVVAQVQAASQQQIAETQADASIKTQEKMDSAKIEQTQKLGEAQVKVAKAKAKATPKKESKDG